MKTVMNNFKMMVITMTAVFMLSFNFVTLASKDSTDNSNEAFQFVGKVENLPVFRLVLNNDNNANYQVTVKEENGEVIFTEKLKGANISRMYKLDTDNTDLISGTTFEVTNKTTNQTTIYKIKNLTSTVDNLTIAKL